MKLRPASPNRSLGRGHGFVAPGHRTEEIPDKTASGTSDCRSRKRKRRSPFRRFRLRRVLSGSTKPRALSRRAPRTPLPAASCFCRSPGLTSYQTSTAARSCRARAQSAERTACRHSPPRLSSSARRRESKRTKCARTQKCQTNSPPLPNQSPVSYSPYRRPSASAGAAARRERPTTSTASYCTWPTSAGKKSATHSAETTADGYIWCRPVS